MKNIANLMKQAQEMQTKMAELQARLEATGVSGGGMVQVTMDGKQAVTAVKIDPALVDPEDVEVLEDLVAAACNDARGKMEALMQEEMKSLTGGLSLPPGMKLPF